MITWESFIESPGRGYWDQTMLADLLIGIDYPNILVTPGHWRHGSVINDYLTKPTLVMITSDEEGECPFWEVEHPVWKMTPNLGLAYRPDRAVPLGYTPHTRQVLVKADIPMDKEGWTFSGQVTNSRRHSAMEALRKLGEPLETEAFTSGLPPADYIKTLWKAEWAPCPAGNVRPETFRMWEALEAGAVPILDATSPAGDQGYWPFTLGDHPFTVLADWSQIGEVMSQPPPLVGPWYSGFKAKFRRDIWDAWRSIDSEPRLEPRDRITTIITASPILSHPGFEILSETVDSVRERLPGNRIIIAFDGPHDSDSRSTYEEHIRRVCYHANLYWPETEIHYSGVWKHQAGTIKDVLPLVYPEDATVLMMEHDTPLMGELPFHRLTELLYEKTFNSIRFHHEAAIPAEHDYLMAGLYEFGDMRVTKTSQYSQRPHVALLSFVSGLLAPLPQDARTYVEDWIYGPMTRKPWPDARMGIYTPEGDIKRSYHTDGRAGAEKREMWW
jgi:hypothetical protein